MSEGAHGIQRRSQDGEALPLSGHQPRGQIPQPLLNVEKLHPFVLDIGHVVPQDPLFRLGLQSDERYGNVSDSFVAELLARAYREEFPELVCDEIIYRILIEPFCDKDIIWKKGGNHI